MQAFYVDVWDYGDLVFMVKTSAEKIPKLGEKVEIDFGESNTEFVEGLWGKETASGLFSFTVTEHCLSPEKRSELPVVESQLAYDEV